MGTRNREEVPQASLGTRPVSTPHLQPHPRRKWYGTHVVMSLVIASQPYFPSGSGGRSVRENTAWTCLARRLYIYTPGDDDEPYARSAHHFRLEKYARLLYSGVGNGGAGGARAPLSFRSRGLSPPTISVNERHEVTNPLLTVASGFFS